MLIDGGWALDEARRQLDAALPGIGSRLADISRFLVTHVHRDHYTQAIDGAARVRLAGQSRAR